MIEWLAGPLPRELIDHGAVFSVYVCLAGRVEGWEDVSDTFFRFLFSHEMPLVCQGGSRDTDKGYPARMCATKVARMSFSLAPRPPPAGAPSSRG